MPHFVIECSESTLQLADPDQLMRSVYRAAESTGLFAVLSVTTFWSFVRELPREGQNWAPVRTVSPV